MKKIITLVIFAICALPSFAKMNHLSSDTLPSTDPLILQLQSINLSSFQGKPVDSLIAHLPSGYTFMDIKGSVRLKHAQYLFVQYASDVVVVISPSSFQYMNPAYVNTSTPTQNWDITLFKKETIGFAVIFNGECLNGCANEFKIN